MADSQQLNWQKATVAAVQEVADDVRRIVLRPERATAMRPGEHVDVRVGVEGQAQTRSYSVVDSAADGAEYALSVARARNSRGGSVFMHSLSVGDVIDVTGPQQNFPLRIGAPSYVVLAGGVGVTAVAGMAALLQRLGVDYRFVYVGRTRSAMAYLHELQALHGDRLEVHVDEEDTSLDVATLVGGISTDAELYMCGPIRLMDAVRRAWSDRGLDRTNLRFETFGNSGWFDASSFTVRVPKFDAEVEVGPNESMLEALESAGLDMMFDCRKGECGLCQVKILDADGQLDHRDVFFSDDQKGANTSMCCCVSRVAPAPSTSEAGTPSAVPVITIELT